VLLIINAVIVAVADVDFYRRRPRSMMTASRNFPLTGTNFLSIPSQIARIRLSRSQCFTSNNMWFLPRDALRKRGLCCRRVSVCLSVCLSSWWIVSRWLKISSNFLFGQLAPEFYFLTPARIPNSKGTLSAAAKFKGGKFFLRFSIIIIIIIIFVIVD